MADNSLDLRYQQDEQPNQSLFEDIKHYDKNGKEFWIARQLMKLLGYKQWRQFADTIEKAITACQNAGNPVSEHFLRDDAKITSVNKAGRKAEDWQLSRYACYLAAMNGDPRKPEIAAAQSYFAAKTREAEVVIPAQNQQLRELELVNENLRMQLEISKLQDNRIALHGLPIALLLEGKADAVVEVEKPVLEVIDERHNVRFRGQSLVQIKDTLNKKYGVKLKSGTDVARVLKRLGLEHLVCQTLRSVSSDYIPEENLDIVYQAITRGDRQLLLGES